MRQTANDEAAPKSAWGVQGPGRPDVRSCSTARGPALPPTLAPDGVCRPAEGTDAGRQSRRRTLRRQSPDVDHAAGRRRCHSTSDVRQLIEPHRGEIELQAIATTFFSPDRALDASCGSAEVPTFSREDLPSAASHACGSRTTYQSPTSADTGSCARSSKKHSRSRWSELASPCGHRHLSRQTSRRRYDPPPLCVPSH